MIPAAARARGASRFGLELFAGSAHFTQAWHRERLLKNVPMFPVDVKAGDDHDLLLRKSQKRVLGWIAGHRVAAVWLGTPCTSFSRARDVPPGPPPLRSDARPYGLAGLSANDVLKVAVGNQLAWFSVRVMEACRKHNVPMALENPYTAWLWLLAGFKRLKRAPGMSFGYTDYCQDGTPWRKRTGILFSHVDLVPSFKHCCGHGTCSRSGKPHVQLRGAIGNKWATLVAEPYPGSLCRRWAGAFGNALVARQVLRLEAICNGSPG